MRDEIKAWATPTVVRERQRWSNQVCTCGGAWLRGGCSAREAVGWWGRSIDVLFVFEEKSIINLSAIECKRAISCYRSASEQDTVCGQCCWRLSCFGEGGTHLFL